MNRDSYLQIFNYLLEFSKIRSRAVRDIDAAKSIYLEKLWISNFPESELIDCVINKEESSDSDYLIKVFKPSEPTEPQFPDPPEKLKIWIEKESLKNRDDFPILKKEVQINEIGETEKIEDNPEIKGLFNEYVDRKWMDDSIEFWKKYEEYEEKYKEYKQISDIYQKLFSIYNKAQQFAEEYELVVGIGLLNYKKNDDSPLICRHVITIKAEIDFEYTKWDSFFVVRPGLNDSLQIEMDAILDLSDQFNSENLINAENEALQFVKNNYISMDIFNPIQKETLAIISNRFSPEGVFVDSLSKPQEIPKKPSIYYTPALLLRKRNTRSFTALYENIINDIAHNADIDISILNDIIRSDLSGIKEKDEGHKNDGIENSDDRIYFPKKYNDEQIAIVKRARRDNKVLVQGPPGTGKSHTIANLICHLLANGKKVLVTAYTKRALDVLKDKLPNDFKNLTVNLLSGDSASIRGLEASVNAINDELSNADISSYRRQIKKLEEELRELEGKIAQDSNELIKIKEKSTRKQEINDYYHGTLLEIAEGLEKDANKYGWYRDDYSDIKNLEIVENVKNYFLLRKEFIKYKVEKLRLELPQKEKIILGKDIEYFNKLIKEIKSRKIIENQIEGIKSKNYVLLRKELDTLGSILIDIEARPHIFKKQIIEDEINDLGEKWGNKINTSRKIIEKLAGYNLVEIDRNYEIKYPKGKGLVDLKNDANTLLSYSKKNGNISGIKFLFKKPFLPREIKEKLYFIEAVKVNGSPCDTESEFNSVIRDIDIKQNYDELTRIWNIKLDYDLKKYNELFDDISRFQKKIETLYAYIKNARKEIKEIERISDIRIKSYDVKYIESLQRKVIDILILKEYKRLRKNINESTKYLSKDEFHPIALQIKEKISELNIGMLGKLLEDLENLKNIKEQYKEHKILEEGLNLVMPNLIEDIKMNRIDKENLMELDKAIYFKDANKKLKRLLNEDYEQKLLEDLSYYDSKKEELISKIASLKAWEHVLHNLEENRTLRQHLEAWVQAVKRIGKTGRGKRALKFRNVAQEEMESCKMAVPCWIMPLYKITETIKPQKEMYDYVIVDEASQLGPDAIFLLYITKNIIIVGDDKQTSPEYIGIDANAMEPYIKKYLKGIPFSNFYGTEFSFFAHAKRFCEGLIVLREHFRCMPEIIEFSNKLFYAPDGKGLYPLKQYSENRLEPLRHVFCQDGFIEGSGQNIRNYNEAKSIVNKISELIKDPKYAGKTMGVISLQGTGQSVLIENLLIKEIGEREFKERKIICGNSASFQGDERDIIILSLVTAHNHRRNALMRPEDERRFNVAVSRAKEQAWLFHSVEMEDLSNTGDLRYKILDHFINYRPENIPKNNKIKRTIGRSPKPFDSWFEVDVYNNIVERGYRVIPQYEVAKGKYRIDLVAIFPNGSKIAIECDGDKWHGSEEYKNDIMRQKVLERCGWQFFRIRGGEYYANRENALTPLWEIFEKNKAVRYEEINNKKAEVSERNLDKVKKELKNKIAFEGEGWHEKIEDDENLLPENKLKRKSDIIQNNKGSNEIYKIRIGSLNIPELWNKSEILLFSDRYNVYKIKNMGFNDTRDVLSSVRVENNEKIIYITGTSNYTGFMIFGFENGKVAKVYMNSYKTVTQRKKLANAYNKKSKLLYVDHIKYDMDLVAISSVNKVLVFNTSLILAKDSRIAQGHQVMKSKKNSVMRMIKKANEVKFESVEYYRKQIPATGNYLKREDKII